MAITPNPPADYTPSMGNYRELKPFRFWCQKVLPLVYDDSLSYYELLCKVVDYLNKTMEDVDTLHTDVENLHTAYEELQAYVNNYFSTLDVQEEINNKLDDMAQSGELSALIVPLLPEPVDEWLAEHITNPSNPPLDTSLTLSNAAAPAKTVGDRLKTKIESIAVYTAQNPLDDMDNAPINTCFSLNYVIGSTAPLNYPIAITETTTNFCITVSPKSNTYDAQSIQIVFTGNNVYIRRRGAVSWDDWISQIDNTLTRTNASAQAKVVGDELAKRVKSLRVYTVQNPLDDMNNAPINEWFVLNYTTGSTAPSNYPYATIKSPLNLCLSVSPVIGSYQSPAMQLVYTQYGIYVRRRGANSWDSWVKYTDNNFNVIPNYTANSPLDDMNNAPINTAFTLNYAVGSTMPNNYPISTAETTYNFCLCFSPKPDMYDAGAIQIAFTGNNTYIRRRGANNWDNWQSMIDNTLTRTNASAQAKVVGDELAKRVKSLRVYTAQNPLDDMDNAPINEWFVLNYVAGSVAPLNYPYETIRSVTNLCLSVSPTVGSYNSPAMQLVYTPYGIYIRRRAASDWGNWSLLNTQWKYGTGIEYFTVKGLHCVVKFPNTYTPFGEPRKWVIICHGSGFMVTNDAWGASSIEADNLNSPFRVNVVDAFVNAGFVVCDCNGQANDTPLRSFGSPLTVDAYYRLYDYMVKTYNVEEKCCVYGFSMGGMVAMNFVNNHMNVVKAVSCGCSVTSLRDYAWNKSGEWRTSIAKWYNFTDWESYTTGSGEATQADFDYFDENANKVVSHNPIAKNYCNMPPVFLFVGADDVNVSPSQTADLISRLVDNEIYVESQVFAGAGHEASYGGVPSIFTNYVIPFFRKFNMN